MLIKFLKGFCCALRGIFYTLKNERHMRIHAVALVYVMFFSVFFNLNIEKYAILLLTGALVIVSEIINSAIESVVDICKNEYSIIAKIAKDMAAGAVLISAIFSVIIAILLFNDMSGYLNIFKFFFKYPIMLLFFGMFSIFSFIYITMGSTEIKNRIKKFITTLKHLKGGNLNGSNDNTKN